jgi:hypothetical protein
MHFKIAGRITNMELIASGKAISRTQTPLEVLRKGAPEKTERHCLRADSLMVRYAMRKSTGTKPTELGRKSTRSSASSTEKTPRAEFVICIGNKGYPASLELRKIYQAIPDETAATIRQIRVIDESGEDYLYPEDYFVPAGGPPFAIFEGWGRVAHPSRFSKGGGHWPR